MAQLMPLPFTVSCFSKIQIGFAFLVPADLGSPDKGPLNGCVCVCIYSLSKWPAMGFEGDAAYIDVIKMRMFIQEFNNTELLNRYFNETGDRLTAMKDFSRINVYVSDPEVLRVN